MLTSVLIVDDDRAFGCLAAEILTDRGYLVVGQAATIAEALVQCARLDPGALLIDVRLPDGDGVRLADVLGTRPDPPIVILTSTDRTAVSPERLLASGARGFVPKTHIAQVNLDLYLKR